MPAGSVLFATPEAAERAFYEALDHADLHGLMALWSDEDEVVCIHPGGPRLVGLREIREAWAEILSRGPLHIHPTQVHAIQTPLTAIHTVIEQVVVEGPQGSQLVSCVATNVFLKGPTGWRLVLHHASAGPDAGMPAGRHELPGILH